MRRSILLILVLTTATYGQQRNLSADAALPAPGSAGTVTLSLAEYNRLNELAARKLKVNEAPPLPFVLSRVAFKLRVEDQRLVGSCGHRRRGAREGIDKGPTYDRAHDSGSTTGW